MTRLATLTKRAALAAALGAALLPGAARADRSDTNDKPVIIVAGPEVPATCSVLAPLRTAIRQEKAWNGTVQQRFSGSIHIVGLNGSGGICTLERSSERITAKSIADASLALSHTIAGVQSATKSKVDVVALGSAGPVLRYALLMSARKRAGLTSFGAGAYDEGLDVEDAVAVGGQMNGVTIQTNSACEPASFCQDLVRPANPIDPKPIHWQLMDSAEQDGANPQGVSGTDWTVIALPADRAAPADTVFGMEAAHKILYEEPSLNLRKALTDDANVPQPVRFLHAPATEFLSSKQGAGPLKRIAQDVIYGRDGSAGVKGPAGAAGCVGYNESSSGETAILEPKMTGWKGDQRAVRVLKFATVEAVADCFKVVPKETTSYVAQGPQWVRVNGMDIHLLDQRSQLKFETKTRRVWLTSGSADAEMPMLDQTSMPLGNYRPNDLVPLDWKFPATDGVLQSDDGTVFAVQSPKDGKFLGLTMQGALTFKVVKGAFLVDITVGLPSVFSGDLAGTSGPPECDNGKDDDGDHKVDVLDDACNGTTLGQVEDNAKASGFTIAVATRNDSGLQFDRLAGNIGGSLRFGPFRTDGAIGFDWNRGEREFKFSVEVRAPAMASASFKLKVGFKQGNLSSIYAELNGLQVPLWSSGWFLQRAGIGFNGIEPGKQLELLISVTASLFKKVGGIQIMSVDGEATTTFNAPWKFKLTGGWNVVDERVGTASFEFEQGVGGKLNVTLGKEWGFMKDATGQNPKLTVIPQGTLAGSMSNAGELDLGATIQACIKGELAWKKYEEPWCLGKADLRLTRFKGQPVTQAMCFRTSLVGNKEIAVGFVNRIGTNYAGHLEILTDWIASSCDVADYGAKQSAVGPAPTDRFTIRPGVDSQVVAIHGPGEGQAPQVTLIAPDGTRLATPTDGMAKQLSDSAFAITGMGDQTAFVLGRPQAGEWRVEVAGGSPPVTKIDVLAVLPEPEVRAQVLRGRGGAFALRHSVAAQPGQTVRFVERAGAVLHEIARTEGGTRRTSFVPAFGPGGRRQIVAVVMQDGRVRRELVVGSYVAPAPARPGRARHITVRRTGQRVEVRWARAARAAKYEVHVDLPDGRGISEIVTRRRFVVRDLIAPGAIRVRIRAMRAQDEAPGRPAYAKATGRGKPTVRRR